MKFRLMIALCLFFAMAIENTLGQGKTNELKPPQKMGSVFMTVYHKIAIEHAFAGVNKLPEPKALLQTASKENVLMDSKLIVNNLNSIDGLTGSKALSGEPKSNRRSPLKEIAPIPGVKVFEELKSKAGH